jgi:17beta-estradiol 17-dehydrogenase / very-long-chain 3-oxoacyl-CoA reductase
MALFGFAAFGALNLSKLMWTYSSGFVQYMMPFGKNLAKRYDYGWAVVTGASDGIGKGYANELASRGFNVVLIARSEEKTNAVAKEIRDKYKVSTKVVLFDFCKLGEADGAENLVKLLDEKVPGEDVSILINNVGICAGAMPADLSIFDSLSSININCRAQAVMTHYFLPKMEARVEKKGVKGGIIDVSSQAKDFSHGLMCMYGSSKIFNHTMS